MFDNLKFVFIFVFVFSFSYFLSVDTSVKLDNYNVSILVISSPKNSLQRRAVRETWAKNIQNVHFVVGCNDILCHEKLQYERQQFNDIVMLNMNDTYRNLPLKVMKMFYWASKNTKANWIFKIDDDAMVFPSTLNQKLIEYSPKRTIIGCIRHNDTVQRNGKWKEYYYPLKKYPAFPLGSCGYIVSKDIVDFIATRDDWFLYQGEDTSLGIWLNDSNYYVNWVNMDSMRNDFTETKCRYNFFIKKYDNLSSWGHGMSAENIKKCYNLLRYKQNLFIQNFNLQDFNLQKINYDHKMLRFLQENPLGINLFEYYLSYRN